MEIRFTQKPESIEWGAAGIHRREIFEPSVDAVALRDGRNQQPSQASTLPLHKRRIFTSASAPVFFSLRTALPLPLARGTSLCSPPATRPAGKRTPLRRVSIGLSLAHLLRIRDLMA